MARREDMRPAYAMHRRVLQQLQWQVPGARWVLKAPSHLFAMDALLIPIPDARIVQTHRDPVTVVASLASMNATLQGAFSDRLEPRDIGHEATRRWTRGLERSMYMRRAGRISERSVRGRPLSCADAGSHGDGAPDLRPARDAAVHGGRDPHAAVPRRQPEGQHGTHRYALESFGLDAESLGRRFKAYCEYFGVPARVARARVARPSTSASTDGVSGRSARHPLAGCRADRRLAGLSAVSSGGWGSSAPGRPRVPDGPSAALSPWPSSGRHRRRSRRPAPRRESAGAVRAPWARRARRLRRHRPLRRRRGPDAARARPRLRRRVASSSARSTGAPGRGARPRRCSSPRAARG